MKLEHIKILEGAELVGTLPSSVLPWTLSQFVDITGDAIVFCNPEHPPMVLRDGVLRNLLPQYKKPLDSPA